MELDRLFGPRMWSWWFSHGDSCQPWIGKSRIMTDFSELSLIFELRWIAEDWEYINKKGSQSSGNENWQKSTIDGTAGGMAANSRMIMWRSSRTARETPWESSRNMAIPMAHKIFDRLSKSLDGYERQGQIMLKLNNRMTSVAKDIENCLSARRHQTIYWRFQEKNVEFQQMGTLLFSYGYIHSSVTMKVKGTLILTQNTSMQPSPNHWIRPSVCQRMS